jgi:predicted nucleic acid-binding protein
LEYLADTNIVARWSIPADPAYSSVRTAVLALHRDGHKVYVTPQNLIEFRAVATRPATANGLGLSTADAIVLTNQIENAFPMLADSEAVYTEWRRLVDVYNIIGRQVYDARLVAVMNVHTVANILTTNPSDFRRFPGIIVVQPHEIK